nr:DUF554 family protein [Ruthenibacterium lactatiformans]
MRGRDGHHRRAERRAAGRRLGAVHQKPAGRHLLCGAGRNAGPGVIFAALPVLVYQGSISLLAGALEPFLAGELLGQICGVGYCLVLCIGINFLGMTKIKTANMLPALLVPVLWSFLQPLFSGAA